MSETEQEPDVPFEEPAPDTGPDEQEAADAEEADAELQPGEQPIEDEAQAEAQAISEKELEQAYKKLAKLRDQNASRVSAIMGDDALNLIPCPLCSDMTPGFIFPPDVAPLQPETEAALRSLLGMNQRGKFKAHPNAELCEVCDGLGSVETPSKVPGYDIVDCPACSATGRILTPAAPPVVTYNGADQSAATAVPAQTPPADIPPEAQALRDAGWLVAPPVVTGPTVQ